MNLEIKNLFAIFNQLQQSEDKLMDLEAEFLIWLKLANPFSILFCKIFFNENVNLKIKLSL